MNRYAKSGNEDFLGELTKWTFQEKGILRVISREVHKEGEHKQHHTYRIKDDVVSSFSLSIYPSFFDFSSISPAKFYKQNYLFILSI